MNMTLQSSIKDKIPAAQKEACDEFVGLQKGLDEIVEHRSDGALYYLDRIWVPLKGDVRTLIMDEPHKMKKDIAVYVSRCLTCLKVKAEHQGLSGLLQQHEIPEWKWEGITMDFVMKLPWTGGGHDPIWVIVDRLTKSAHFLPMHEDYKMDRKCRSSIMWAKVGEGQLIGLELVQETTKNISQIKDRLKAVRDRQKSYADKKRKPLEFSVGDYVLLKVSPWKGVVLFRKKGKLAPRFVGPFEIIEKKCLADPTLQVPLDKIQVDAKLNFVEEPVDILEREFKKLKRGRITIVKVQWNSKRTPEFTWEREDQMRLKYPHLFSADSS
ncbi:putative reverse transcriptase domain-containing protein [Tanacetum coccineum]|uniref:Reverse transcriptase domain-containing protein n=1 Tax=Tanacetum coccineum TaxID=301880 RepID=A0ABQ4ZJ48_9ASTR